MAVTPESFRQNYPEFADPEAYRDFMIEMHVTVALQFLNANRWGGVIDFGTQLWVAHFLTLQARDLATVEAGGIPGALQGILTAKAVDKVSASYDASSVSLTDAGFWSLSRYGIQFLQFSRMMGAGGIQLGGGAGGAPPWLGYPC